MHSLIRSATLVGAVLGSSLIAAPAWTQTTAPPRAASATPSDLPPGATSTRGDKAAVPASAASEAVDPNTGSTAGKPPGATSTRGDKAATPKGAGTPASGAASPVR